MLTDPTAQEMREHLKNVFGDEPSEFDIEEAIYWFANDWHGGQASNLYSALSTSQYKPGPCSNGPEPDSISGMMYDELESQFTS